MNGCIYRTKDGECDLYAEGGKYTAFCEMENCEGRKMSNADRIRSMTDEELATWLEKFTDCDICPITRPNCVASGCKGAWLKWLRSEVKE